MQISSLPPRQVDPRYLRACSPESLDQARIIEHNSRSLSDTVMQLNEVRAELGKAPISQVALAKALTPADTINSGLRSPSPTAWDTIQTNASIVNAHDPNASDHIVNLSNRGRPPSKKPITLKDVLRVNADTLTRLNVFQGRISQTRLHAYITSQRADISHPQRQVMPNNGQRPSLSLREPRRYEGCANTRKPQKTYARHIAFLKQRRRKSTIPSDTYSTTMNFGLTPEIALNPKEIERSPSLEGNLSERKNRLYG